jgi:hypothetical protein
MGIVPTRAAGPKVARSHDALVCGIDYYSDCDTCRARAEAAELAFVHRDAEARAREQRHVTASRLFEVTGIQLQELAVALLPALAEGVVEIVDAVRPEEKAP